MASIQIKADIVIKACEKMITHIDESYTFKHPEAKIEFKDQHVLLSSVRRNIESIKKLAEYAIKPRHGDGYIESNSGARITITHNDYELIGEFL